MKDGSGLIIYWEWLLKYCQYMLTFANNTARVASQVAHNASIILYKAVALENSVHCVSQQEEEQEKLFNKDLS